MTFEDLLDKVKDLIMTYEDLNELVMGCSIYDEHNTYVFNGERFEKLNRGDHL